MELMRAREWLSGAGTLWSTGSATCFVDFIGNVLGRLGR
jgi:hypothetical protein